MSDYPLGCHDRSQHAGARFWRRTGLPTLALAVVMLSILAADLDSAVAAAVSARSVAAGSGFGCVVTGIGGVKCWGAGVGLGNGTTSAVAVASGSVPDAATTTASAASTAGFCLGAGWSVMIVVQSGDKVNVKTIA